LQVTACVIVGVQLKPTETYLICLEQELYHIYYKKLKVYYNKDSEKLKKNWKNFFLHYEKIELVSSIGVDYDYMINFTIQNH